MRGLLAGFRGKAGKEEAGMTVITDRLIIGSKAKDRDRKYVLDVDVQAGLRLGKTTRGRDTFWGQFEGKLSQFRDQNNGENPTSYRYMAGELPAEALASAGSAHEMGDVATALGQTLSQVKGVEVTMSQLPPEVADRVSGLNVIIPTKFFIAQYGPELPKGEMLLVREYKEGDQTTTNVARLKRHQVQGMKSERTVYNGSIAFSKWGAWTLTSFANPEPPVVFAGPDVKELDIKQTIIIPASEASQIERKRSGRTPSFKVPSGLK